MTCLIALAPFGFLRPRGRAWLLRTTSFGDLRSCPSSGPPITEIEPLIIAPEYWLSRCAGSQPVRGVRPPHGFGPAPESFVFVTKSFLPSRVTLTAAGAQ